MGNISAFYATVPFLTKVGIFFLTLPESCLYTDLDPFPSHLKE